MSENEFRIPKRERTPSKIRIESGDIEHSESCAWFETSGWSRTAQGEGWAEYVPPVTQVTGTLWERCLDAARDEFRRQLPGFRWPIRFGLYSVGILLAELWIGRHCPATCKDLYEGIALGIWLTLSVQSFLWDLGWRACDTLERIREGDD